ncbi:DedA family protein [Litchfieldia alkalitelluris]|uniref:DedA family protein n=1 Tax=Litchfieldia alkalitelluris TaxID=304268 RepID=UPI000997BA52|nr:VTT domain-containing protein [Litchfieldia alkalitelluris]
MAEFVWKVIEEWGIWGVLAALLVEGSAVPFFGTLFIVTVGFIMELSWTEITMISFVGSFLYALGSYIPYFIGRKLGSSVESRLSSSKREKLEKINLYFNKFGIWSVAIFSPLHLGSVVPLVAGMFKMNLRIYTLLIMVGMAPSTFLLLSIGRFYQGDSNTLLQTINHYQIMILLGIGGVTILYLSLKQYRHNQKKKLSNPT